MTTEREYYLNLNLKKMAELGVLIRHLPASKREKAERLHESILNYLNSDLQRESSDA